jgi:hypothetical protein
MSFTILATYTVTYEQGQSRRISRCRCGCGALFSARIEHLRSGNTKSCGCLRNAVLKVASEHKKGTRKLEVSPSNRRSPLYGTYLSWVNMRQRCENPKVTQFKDYGGRGITVCPQWARFEVFLADMGVRPPGLTLDRSNNDGNYEPGNCRWATRKEQSANRRAKGPHSAETRERIRASVNAYWESQPASVKAAIGEHSRVQMKEQWRQQKDKKAPGA